MKLVLYIWLTLAISALAGADFYSYPPALGDYRWMTEAESLIRPMGKSQYKTNDREHFIELKGRFELPVFPPDGQALRLRFRDGHARNLRLLIFCGSRWYQVEHDHQVWSFLVAHEVIGKPGEDRKKRVVRRITDDQGRWHAYRDGSMDVGYSDGFVNITRGPVSLLRFPVREKPTSMILETDTRLSLIQVVEAAPVGDDTSAPVFQPDAPPTRWSWKPDGNYRGREDKDPVKFTAGEDGSYTLSATDAKSWRQAQIDVPINGPFQVTMKLEDLTAGVGIFLTEHNRHQTGFVVGSHDKRLVVCEDAFNRGNIERYRQLGLFIDGSVYCRFVYNLDYHRVELSQDGMSWYTYQWHRSSASRPRGDLTVGLRLIGGKRVKHQKIRLARMEIRPISALEYLVDPYLLARVPELTDKDRRLNSKHAWLRAEKMGTFPDAPEGTDRDEWLIAWDVKILNSLAPAATKQNAARDLIQRAVNSGMAADKIFRVLRDLETLFMPRHRLGDDNSLEFSEHMIDLGERIVNRGEADAFGPWQSSWYALDYNVPRHRDRTYRFVPPPLIRHALYQAWNEEDWARLNLVARKYLFFSSLSRENKLAQWMVEEASLRRPELLAGKKIGETLRQIHPLRIRSERETENLLGELGGAIENREYQRACLLLTRGEISDTLTARPDEPSVFKPAGSILRELVDGQAEFARVLQSEFAAMGTIRLNRMLTEEDLEGLDQIVTQFHGSDAAHRAWSLLADRDLNLGYFSRAAQRYGMILDGVDERTMSRYRLVRALNGYDAPGALTGNVVLGEQTVSASDFEILLKDILSERRRDDEDLTLERRPPYDKDCKLGPSAEVPFYSQFDMGGQRLGNTLALQQENALACFSLEPFKLKWQVGESTKTHKKKLVGPTIADRAVVAAITVEKKQELQGFHPASGKVLWRTPVPGRVVVDPVARGDDVYALIIKDGDLGLFVFDAVDGREKWRRFLIPEMYSERRVDPLRELVLHEDLCLVLSKGFLVCCDDRGGLRWVRRLPVIPQKVDPVLNDDESGTYLWPVEGAVVIVAPGSPYVQCVDLTSGALRWSVLQPDRRRLLGGDGERMVLLGWRNLYAYDAASGRLKWTEPIDDDLYYLWPAHQDTFVGVRLDRIDPAKITPEQYGYRRQVTWFGKTDGKQVAVSREPLGGYTQSGVGWGMVYKGNLVLWGKSESNLKMKDARSNLYMVTFP